MSNAVVNIDAFRGQQMPAAFRNALNAAEESLADGIGQSYGVIHYKGKVWSLQYRGDRKNFVRPDDGTPSTYIDVIILRQARSKSKSFYQQFDANASDGQRPLCSSIDGVTPDSDSMQRQAQACALCPRNEWKVNPVTGKKQRECSDYKRLAVLLLPTQSQAMFGQPLMEPVFLRVPAGSLNDLATMGETMKAQGWHFSSFITRISFDPNEAHPKMVFRPLQALTDAEAPVVIPLRDDSIAKRITGEDPVANIPAPVLPTQPVVTTGLAQPVVSPQPAVLNGVPQQQPIQQQQLQHQAPQPVYAPPVATGFAGVMQQGQGARVIEMAPNPQPQPTAPVATADVGVPQEADALLDAKIAGLLNPSA